MFGDPLKKARKKVRAALKGARRPVVLWSSGKDSMLLLALAREVRPAVDVLWLREGLTPAQRRFAERVVAEWDLTVYGYLPAQRYLVPAGAGVSVVDEYSVGDRRLPVLRDVEEGESCVFDATPSAKTPFFAYGWDRSLAGWKSEDSHPATGPNPFPADATPLGPTRLYAPLRHMSDAQVWDAIFRLGVPYDAERYDRHDGASDPDTVAACTRCLTAAADVFCPKEGREIRPEEWDREGVLDFFRSRFGIKGPAAHHVAARP